MKLESDRLGKVVMVQDFERVIRDIPNLNDLKGETTVLLTGAGGFLSSFLCASLDYANKKHDLGLSVIGVVRNLERAKRRLAPLWDNGCLRLFEHDLSMPLKLDENIDYIIHAASQASPKYYSKDPVGTALPNIVGTNSLLDLARKNPIKGMVFFSSGEVYGVPDPTKIPLGEQDFGYLNPMELRSCYAESKKMGENLCVSYYHQYGVPVKVVRLFHTYGPGMNLEDGRVFADFVRCIVRNEDIQMLSDGAAVRPFCYISDAMAGVLTVLLKGQSGEAYNVGNPKAEIKILDLANLLVGLFPERSLKVVQQERDNSSDYMESPILRNCPKIEKINSLGWEPEVSLEEGFTKTVRSYE